MENTLHKSSILNYLKAYLTDIECGYFVENSEEMYIYKEAYNSTVILKDAEKLIENFNEKIAHNEVSVENAYETINDKLKSFEVYFDVEYDLENNVPNPNKIQTLKERNFNLYDAFAC